MAEPYVEPEPVPMLEAAACAARALETLLDPGGTRIGPLGPIVRIQIPVHPCEPLLWLQGQPHMTQYYWTDRVNTFEMAGVGEADVVVPETGAVAPHNPFQTMRRRLPAAPRGPRYYGGFRFHSGPTRGERWRAFLDYRFVVPQFEVVRRGGRCHFACNVLLRDPETNRRAVAGALDALARLAPAATPGPLNVPRVHSRSDVPDRDGWSDLIRKTLDAFRVSPLEKVVLARETCFETDGPLDPVALLRCLMAHTERSFGFCFHPAPDRAFIGASPERLYRRVQSYVQSEAVAATRRRGSTPAEDERLGAELMNDEKSRREHAFVARMLMDTLGGLCRVVHSDEAPSLLRLRTCQHLYLRAEGLLHEPWDDAALITALHPTPAVGGTPRDRALRWISDHEGFDRGIYASPVGWVGPDAAEFCVAIRSGLVQRDQLVLYNGAGIVAGSEPAEEWEELENKMANFLQVLSVHA